MKPRSSVLLGICALVLASTWLGSCSSGLGNNLPSNAPSTGRNSNLPVGLDLGLTPTDPTVSPAIAGVRVPAIGTAAAREVALLAFSTAAPSDNGDGNGTPLTRDATTDGNGAADIFVAAVCAQDVDTTAFSQSLAGKFRFPRCATCHSMQRPDSLAFVSSPLPHAGPLPGPTFPNNDPATCKPCHVDSNTFPVDGWQAPAASFDIRSKSVAQLALMAQNVPAGDTEHFVNDKRVLWALDSGILPQVGGRNGIADDNQDGVFQPEDEDGVPRTVPGGSANFLSEITAWNAGGNVVNNAGAVKDLTLVSRAVGTSAAGNGASTSPRVVWVPNAGFNATSSASAFASNPIGTLYIAYQSTASNLVAADANGAQDVFRTAVQLRAEEDANGAFTAGSLNLLYVDSTVLCSAVNGSTTAANGASGRPVIGGSNGEWVAFESVATNLIGGFTDGNGAGADVYLRLIGVDQTELVSHTVGNAATGGNGSSERPALDGGGTAIAFESDASDLINSDLNAVRDVFHARSDTGSPFTKVRASVTSTGAEGTGGPSSAASIYRSSADRFLVAFQSDKTDLAAGLAATTNVYLFDSDSGSTTLLNQRIAPSGNAIGNGSARAPAITADGAIVAFESEASNIDVLRPGDLSYSADIFLVETVQVAAGSVLPYRTSITATEGADANGASTAPTVGTFTGSDNFKVGLLAYPTLATNLATSDSTNIVIAFLDETSGVLADFTATPLSGVAPVQVQFTDASSGAPTAWQWDFDNDGTVDSTEQNPLHTYTTPGSYTVKLVASNANASGEKVAVGFVRAIGPVVPDFTASVTSGPAPLSVTFTDTSTEQPNAWEWDFENDGTVDSAVQNPTFAYTTPGIYAVKLTASNEAGSATTTKTALIEVFAPVVPNFTRTPTTGATPLLVNFTNTSTGATSYQWDFDEDGVVDSTAVNPSFTYTIAGDYDVTLTATGPGGTNSFTFVSCVSPFGSLAASFTISASSGYTTTPINFTDTSTGTITDWAWDFDNVPGTTESTLQNPTGILFTTSSQTVYTVRLTITGPGGTAFATQTFTSVATSESVTLDANADNTIYQNNTNNSNGASTIMVSGNTNGSGPRRAMVKFDVAGNVPAGATINTAQLQLTHLAPTGGTPAMTGTRAFTLHRITSNWTEGTSSTTTTPGVGVAAAGGGATWDNRITPATAWGSAGGDFAASSGTVTITNAFATFGSTSVASPVQTWLDTPATNFGFMIVGVEGTLQTVKWIGTRENATAGSRPKLVINYTRALP